MKLIERSGQATGLLTHIITQCERICQLIKYFLFHSVFTASPLDTILPSITYLKKPHQRYSAIDFLQGSFGELWAGYSGSWNVIILREWILLLPLWIKKEEATRWKRKTAGFVSGHTTGLQKGHCAVRSKKIKAPFSTLPQRRLPIASLYDVVIWLPLLPISLCWGQLILRHLFISCDWIGQSWIRTAEELLTLWGGYMLCLFVSHHFGPASFQSRDMLRIGAHTETQHVGSSEVEQLLFFLTLKAFFPPRCTTKE